MAAIAKIAHNSPSRQNPSELETAVANAFTDLENNATDIKATLRPLQFVSAREVRIAVFCSCFFCFFAIDSWMAIVARRMSELCEVMEFVLVVVENEHCEDDLRSERSKDG